MVDAERGEGVEDCVDNGLRCGDAAGLARTFDPQRIGGGRDLGQRDLEGRQVVSLRQCIVGKEPLNNWPDPES